MHSNNKRAKQRFPKHKKNSKNFENSQNLQKLQNLQKSSLHSPQRSLHSTLPTKRSSHTINPSLSPSLQHSSISSTHSTLAPSSLNHLNSQNSFFLPNSQNSHTFIQNSIFSSNSHNIINTFTNDISPSSHNPHKLSTRHRVNNGLVPSHDDYINSNNNEKIQKNSKVSKISKKNNSSSLSLYQSIITTPKRSISNSQATYRKYVETMRRPAPQRAPKAPKAFVDPVKQQQIREKIAQDKRDAKEKKFNEMLEQENSRPAPIVTSTLLIHEDGFVDKVLDKDIRRMKLRLTPLGKVVEKEKPKKLTEFQRAKENYSNPKPKGATAHDLDEDGRIIKSHQRDYEFLDTDETRKLQKDIRLAAEIVPFADIDAAKKIAENIKIEKIVRNYIKQFYPAYLKELIDQSTNNASLNPTRAIENNNKDGDVKDGDKNEKNQGHPIPPSSTRLKTAPDIPPSPFTEMVSMLASTLAKQHLGTNDVTKSTGLVPLQPSNDLVKLPIIHEFASPDMSSNTTSWYQCPISIDGDKINVDADLEDIHAALPKINDSYRSISLNRFAWVLRHYDLVKKKPEKPKDEKPKDGNGDGKGGAGGGGGDDKKPPGKKKIDPRDVKAPVLPALAPGMSFDEILRDVNPDGKLAPEEVAKKVMIKMKELQDEADKQTKEEIAKKKLAEKEEKDKALREELRKRPLKKKDTPSPPTQLKVKKRPISMPDPLASLSPSNQAIDIGDESAQNNKNKKDINFDEIDFSTMKVTPGDQPTVPVNILTYISKSRPIPLDEYDPSDVYSIPKTTKRDKDTPRHRTKVPTKLRALVDVPEPGPDDVVDGVDDKELEKMARKEYRKDVYGKYMSDEKLFTSDPTDGRPTSDDMDSIDQYIQEAERKLGRKIPLNPQMSDSMLKSSETEETWLSQDILTHDPDDPATYENREPQLIDSSELSSVNEEDVRKYNEHFANKTTDSDNGTTTVGSSTDSFDWDGPDNQEELEKEKKANEKKKKKKVNYKQQLADLGVNPDKLSDLSSLPDDHDVSSSFSEFDSTSLSDDSDVSDDANENTAKNEDPNAAPKNPPQKSKKNKDSEYSNSDYTSEISTNDSVDSDDSSWSDEEDAKRRGISEHRLNKEREMADRVSKRVKDNLEMLESSNQMMRRTVDLSKKKVSGKPRVAWRGEEPPQFDFTPRKRTALQKAMLELPPLLQRARDENPRLNRNLVPIAEIAPIEPGADNNTKSSRLVRSIYDKPFKNSVFSDEDTDLDTDLSSSDDDNGRRSLGNNVEGANANGLTTRKDNNNAQIGKYGGKMIDMGRDKPRIGGSVASGNDVTGLSAVVQRQLAPPTTSSNRPPVPFREPPSPPKQQSSKSDGAPSTTTSSSQESKADKPSSATSTKTKPPTLLRRGQTVVSNVDKTDIPKGIFDALMAPKPPSAPPQRKKSPSEITRERDVWYMIRKIQKDEESKVKTDILRHAVEEVNAQIVIPKAPEKPKLQYQMPKLFTAHVSNTAGSEMSDFENQNGRKM